MLPQTSTWTSRSKRQPSSWTYCSCQMNCKGWWEERTTTVWVGSFSSFVAILDMCIGVSERDMMPCVHTLCSNLLGKGHAGLDELFWTEAEPQYLNCEMSHFHKIMVDTLAKHCSTKLFTSKFYLLEHIVEDFQRSGTLFDLDSSLLEHYNLHISISYCRASISMKTRMEESLKVPLLCCKVKRWAEHQCSLSIAQTCGRLCIRRTLPCWEMSSCRKGCKSNARRFLSWYSMGSTCMAHRKPVYSQPWYTLSSKMQ